MNLSELELLTRWKHVEVIYDRLSSGGLNERQRNGLRADLSYALGQCHPASSSEGKRTDAYEPPALPLSS